MGKIMAIAGLVLFGLNTVGRSGWRYDVMIPLYKHVS